MTTPPDSPHAESIEIITLDTAETHGLRLSVLRHNTPTREVEFPEDDLPGVEHLGLRLDGRLVAISSWVPRAHGDEPRAVQLRGMATDRSLQRRGLGGILLEAGCRRRADDGARLVWANARDSALDFYLRHGFDVEGDGFIEQVTGFPHHVIVRRLTPGGPSIPPIA